MKGAGETIERQRARLRNDVPTIDQPASETSFALDELVEMNACRVLIKSRSNLMLGFLDSDAVDMVNAFADLIIVKAVRTAGECKVVSREVDRRTSLAEEFRIERRRQARDVIARRRRRLVAFAHHDPTDIFEYRRA